MDISSLPEAEQQQLRQLQQQFQEHQAQQQQQQQQNQNQDYYCYSYNQTQVQSNYGQSYYSYYHHHHQQQQQQQNQTQNQQQQHYAYYQTDYASAYQQPPHRYHHHHYEAAAQVPDSALHNPRLNPAAAAALSQLTHFAGTMEAAERAVPGLNSKSRTFGPGRPIRSPLVGEHLYKGNDRGGGEPFQGRGQRNFGYPLGSGPRFRGRGRGRGWGRSRHFQPRGATSTSSHPEPSVAEHVESQGEGAELSAEAPENTSQSAPAAGKGAESSRTAQIAWCELCRVDCTSLEVLEQHKNGRRHKKNLLRMEELKNAVKLGAEMQNEQAPANNSMQEVCQQAEITQDAAKQAPAENFTLEAASNEQRTESDLQHATEEKPLVPVESSSDMQAKKPKRDHFENKRRGMKRKMKGGKGGEGGKRMKTFETPKRPIEPPKSKVVIPLICDLCNVKCDTQEVLDRHLSGKKHVAKLKRFESHQAMYGPVGLQALYPPNPIAQTLFVPHGHQPFHNHQGSFPPSEGYFTSQACQVAAAATSLEPQLLLRSMPQQSEAAFESNGQNDSMVASSSQQQ